MWGFLTCTPGASQSLTLLLALPPTEETVGISAWTQNTCSWKSLRPAISPDRQHLRRCGAGQTLRTQALIKVENGAWGDELEPQRRPQKIFGMCKTNRTCWQRLNYRRAGHPRWWGRTRGCHKGGHGRRWWHLPATESSGRLGALSPGRPGCRSSLKMSLKYWQQTGWGLSSLLLILFLPPHCSCLDTSLMNKPPSLSSNITLSASGHIWAESRHGNARASEKAGLQFFALPQPASGAEDTDPGRPSQMGRRHHCVHGKSSSSSQRNGSIKRLIREADFELLRGIQRTAYNQQVVSGIRKSPTTGQAEELLAGQDRDCPPRLPSPGHTLH